ncbi:unnamed protein product [Rodentolepis nana]|uniref:DNA 3'-5' helicase n=1 Tax=Rodentolepis nana TaxID=102285 RepID=A0A0R3TVN2_RODNA|nr:unnamed protein product [Rodentolepis nana]
MAEPNPWDEMPVNTKLKLKEPQEIKSQLSLFSRLKTKMLSSNNILPMLPKLTKQQSSLLSKFSNDDGVGPIQVSSLTSPCSVHTLDSESKENISFVSTEPDIVSFSELTYEEQNKSVKSTSKFTMPMRPSLVKPKSSSRAIKKSGSFLSNQFRDLADLDTKPTGNETTPFANQSDYGTTKVLDGLTQPLLKETSSFYISSQDSFDNIVPTSCNPAPTINHLSEKSSALISAPSLDQSSGCSVQPMEKSGSSFLLPSSSSCHGKRSRPTPTGNYLKLNLRKKCFSRGGSRRQARSRFAVRNAKYAAKFGNWKKGGGKFVAKSGRKACGTCFKCGQEGHWVNKCPKVIYGMSASKPSTQEIEEMDPDYSHAEWRITDVDELNVQFPNGPQLADLLNYSCPSTNMQLSPILGDGAFEIEKVREYMTELLSEMCIDSFRPGQERVIWRLLGGKSTLLILPTAGGKSLCYQIPAAVYQKFCPNSIALVISPLISLMQDQILSSFSPIRGAYLSSSQTKDEKEVILQAIKAGQYAYVLMSPEALVETDWILRKNCLPPISFVCVDEAHCLADWSHHFRPSYLQICNLLRTRLGITRFLGLSATCTPLTIRNICSNLGIGEAIKLDAKCNSEEVLSSFEPAGGYLQPISCPIPSNLLVTASMDHNRDEALIKMLQRPPFSEQLSILVYAATRDLTERLAGYIRTYLQDVKEKIGRRTVSWNTAVYHAGLPSKVRDRVQKRFMSGKIRVLVATSAFGMGLNKQDLQAVIHYSLPKSFENYIQEIGRVGRNGQQSYCHTFLPPGFSSQSEDADEDGEPVITPEESREANELRRHIFANHIDTVQLKRLLNLIAGRRSRVVALDPDQIAEELDIKPESLATLITYMHLRADMQPLVSILPSWPAKVTFSCYGGPLELARVSTKCLAMSAWLGHLKSQAIPGTPFPSPTLREVTIDLSLLCNNWGWKPDSVLRELRSFEWDTTGPSGAPRRSGVSVSLVGSTRATWLWVHPLPTGSSLSERLDAEVVYLRHRLGEVERAGLRSLAQLQSAIALVAARCIDDIDFEDEHVKSKSDQLHSRVEAHFCETIDEEAVMASWPRPITKEKEESVCRTVSEFLRLHSESVASGQVTGRVMANIFQGIGSPNFPAYSWSPGQLKLRTSFGEMNSDPETLLPKSAS